MDKIQSDNPISYPTEECSKKRGRPRLYAKGYSRVQSQLKKQIKLRTNVYSKWNIAKDIWAKENFIQEADINNSDFANALLHCYENLRHLIPESVPNKESTPLKLHSTALHQGQPQLKSKKMIDLKELDISGIVQKNSITEDHSFKTPREVNVMTVNEPLLTSIRNEHQQNRYLSKLLDTPRHGHNSHEFGLDRFMVDSIIENSRIMNISASAPVAESEAVEYNDDIELMEKMQDEDTDREDEPDFDLDRDMHEYSQLLDAIPEDCEQVIDSEETDYSIVDMDVSELVDKFIETNVPVSELLIEKHLPKTLLLPTLYEESLFDDCNLDDYLEDVKKDRVIVDVDRLLLLFKKCLEKNCAGEIIQTELKFKGCNINVLWKCQNKHKGAWSTSNTTRDMYTNNLMMAASVLFTGNNWGKIEDFCNIFNIQHISKRTFELIQRTYLFPAIDEFYLRSQGVILRNLQDNYIVVAGDGQMDSPGHSAKHCVYSLMDATNYYILHVENIDVRITKHKSSVMEKKGCELGLSVLLEQLEIDEFVSDANTQIIKMLREDERFESIHHQLDVWHKSIKLTKKLNEVAKKRGNGILFEWISDIRNHFWYCSKMCGGNLFEFKIMWTSILKHVTNRHVWQDGECTHGPLLNHNKSWIDENSPAMKELRKIVMDSKWLKSMKFYTKFRHTGVLESYHNARLKYAPKRIDLTYNAHIARSRLAVIDHNHHLGRQQARTKAGKTKFTKKFSKRTKTHNIVIVKEAKNYSYLPYLCAKVCHNRQINMIKLQSPVPIRPEDPMRIAPNIATRPAPSTEELKKNYTCRF